MSDWIKCEDELPQLQYNEKMNYWYSVPVMTRNISGLRKRCLMSHDGIHGSFGSCIGGHPREWRYLEEGEE